MTFSTSYIVTPALFASSILVVSALQRRALTPWAFAPSSLVPSYIPTPSYSDVDDPQSLLEAFRRDGYAVIPQVLTPEGERVIVV